MEWKSTNGMTNENAPKGQVLVQYLNPLWGSFSVEFAIGYFDNPNDYENPAHGDGWKEWFSSQKIKVIAYAELPPKIQSPFTEMKQEQFFKQFASSHPNLGSVGT